MYLIYIYNSMNWKNRYLKYKLKYIQLIQQVNKQNLDLDLKRLGLIIWLH